MNLTDRFHSSTEDFRDPFDRDRDRIIHASSFRRLEYKTQVFINHEGDYFRTRLTHSLEVSQIARTICKSLGLNETLAEVIALSHDLGHTPFGHVGGDELDRLLKADGFSNGFEHNFQSFRVVTKLEKRKKDYDGLNLTYATLEGILKHSTPYKMPFFNKWHEENFALDYHPTLEAIVVDYADEIAYTSHDIDDGLKYGLISIDDIKDSELVQEAMRRTKEEGVEVKDKIYRRRLVKHLINILVNSFIEHSKSCSCDELRGEKILATEKTPIGFSKETARKLKMLKKIMFKELYAHHKILRNMHSGKVCVQGIYKALMSDERLLPKEQRAKLEYTKKHRVIADFIAGMTDRYALKYYKQLHP